MADCDAVANDGFINGPALSTGNLQHEHLVDVVVRCETCRIARSDVNVGVRRMYARKTLIAMFDIAGVDLGNEIAASFGEPNRGTPGIGLRDHSFHVRRTDERLVVPALTPL